MKEGNQFYLEFQIVDENDNLLDINSVLKVQFTIGNLTKQYDGSNEGVIYDSANNKDRPIIFEVFTDTKDESEALFILSHIVSDSSKSLFHTVKDTVRSVVGDKGIRTLKNLIKWK